MKQWNYRQQATGTWCVESGSTIAHVYGRDAEKLARLISAAPELFAVVDDWVSMRGMPNELKDRAKAALAKAKS